jgi:hypothetical protein
MTNYVPPLYSTVSILSTIMHLASSLRLCLGDLCTEGIACPLYTI